MKLILMHKTIDWLNKTNRWKFNAEIVKTNEHHIVFNYLKSAQ